MIGNVNDMLFSKETIGNVLTVVLVRHKYITKDTRKETLEKNQSNGLFQFVNLAMTINIEKSRTHNSTYPKVAVQWLNQALCFYESFCLIDSEVLRNRHLRVAAKR
jgi:hypothetical protein